MANLFGSVWEAVYFVQGNPAFPSEFTDPNQKVGIANFPDGELTAIPGKVLAGDTLPGQSTRLYKDSGQAAAIAGTSDWYVNKIWVDPSPMSFGSIIGAKTITLTLLSTFRYDDRIFQNVDISALGAGITVDNDPTPLVMPPLSEVDFDVTATSEGPPSFDDDIVLEFDHRDITVRATGRRLILFWYEPEQPLREDLAWKTDILTTRDGNEQRDSLRSTPRQVFTFNILAETDAEASSLHSLLLVFRPFVFGVPVWFERKRVTANAASGSSTLLVDTANMDLRVNGSIMVWEPVTRTFFDAGVSAFDATSITLTQALVDDVSARAEIIPLRFGTIIDEPRYDSALNGLRQTTVIFETTDNVDLGYADNTELEADFVLHPDDDLPIVSSPNLLSFGNTYSQNQQTRYAREDNEIGIAHVARLDPRSSTVKASTTLAQSQTEVNRMRKFLHWIRGSWASFYLPTFRNDTPLLVDTTLDNDTLTVSNTNLAELIGINQPRRTLMLTMANGRQFFSQIASVLQLTNTEEQIVLSNAFDGASSEAVPASSSMLSFVELVRIEGDSATIIHNRIGQANIRMQVRTVQQ